MEEFIIGSGNAAEQLIQAVAMDEGMKKEEEIVLLLDVDEILPL